MKGSRVFTQPFFQVPTALLTYRSIGGRCMVIPVSWAGIVCSQPSTISVSFLHPGKSSEELPMGREGGFGVNFPPDIHLTDPDFLANLADHEGDILIEAGLTLKTGRTGVPIIAECPVQVECRKGSAQWRFDQVFISGEVACVHLDGRIYGPDRPVNLCRLDPFAPLRRLFSPGDGAPTLQEA